MSNGQKVDPANLKQYIVPAAGVALIVVLVGLVVVYSGASERKMSDGSDGTVSDPGLKEITPGVRVRDIKDGVGESCPAAANVTIHYTGWLTDGTVFDSSKEGKTVQAPATFDLDGLIPGWRDGIPGMKPGGIRKLVISPDKGYGTQTNGKIPGGSTLIFEVQLIDFKAKSPPRDTSKLADGSVPNADDPNLKPLGNEGLQYRDIKEGSGLPVPPGAEVTINYIGWTLKGDPAKPFDSSYKNGEPTTFSLGNLIKGWQQGIPGMKPGGVRKLVIPAELGYGAKGSPPNIPPNATLVFEVELVK